MKNVENVTIEMLAEMLDGKMWIKGDIQRVYVDRGYSTKKMKTSTYVHIKDGKILVSCFVDCPSQPYQWCQSQANEVIRNLETQIKDGLKKSENPEKYANMPYTQTVLSVCKKEVVAQTTAEMMVVNVDVVVVETEKYSEEFSNLTGEKFEHKTFGIGKKISETAEVIELFFLKCGSKKLLKNFASLKKVS